METILSLLQNISKFGWAFLGGCITLGCYFILEKFKNRLSNFTYKINYNTVGTTLADNVFGEIVVHHNSREIPHLNFITVNIKNDSNSDFEKVNIHCWVDSRSQILGWSGNYDDTGLHLQLNDEYQKQEAEFQTEYDGLTQQQIDAGELSSMLAFYMKNKQITLPVFNRDSSITLHFLVENFDGNAPNLRCPVSHKSVRMVLEEDRNEKLNKAGKYMVVYGYVIMLIVTAFLFSQHPLNKNGLILYAIFAFSYMWIGLAFYYLLQYLKSIFK